VTLQIFIDGAPAVAAQSGTFGAGETFENVSAFFTNVTSFSPGTHTFSIVATATGGAGNCQIPASTGRITVRVYGA